MDELYILGCLFLVFALVVAPVLAVIGFNRSTAARQEIARLVGCSREMAGRVLKKLQADGILHARGKTIVLYGTR